MTAPAWATPERAFHERARSELLAGATGEAFSLGPLNIRAAALPLFRRGRSRDIEQAIRLAIESDVGASVRLRLEIEGTTVDAANVDLRPGRQTLRLFIPEVTQPIRLTVRAIGAGAAEVACDLVVMPSRKWQIYLVQQSHFDIGYTDPQALVVRHHINYLDSVLDLIGNTDEYPEDARFRWNVEGTWTLKRWLAARPPAASGAFLNRVREGRIGIDAFSFNMHTEACSIDELGRQMAFAGELRDRYAIPITTATQTDVPGASQALVGLLADAGIRFLSVAHNFAGRAVPYLGNGQSLLRPFKWRSAGGQEVMVWYTDSAHGLYSEGNVLGLAEGYEVAAELLPEYLAALAERPYPYQTIAQTMTWPGLPMGFQSTKTPYPHDILHLRVQGVIADNAPPSPTPADVVRQWNETWVHPRLRIATNAEFFLAAESRLGAEVPVFTGDWTDWWADGLGSGARELGLNRRAQSDLAVAQALHHLGDVLEPIETVQWAAPLEAAYENLALFDEHTWGAAEPWGDGLERRDSGALQWRQKAGFAIQAYEGSQDLLGSVKHRLSSLLASKEGASAAVFNPSPSVRSDLVEVFLPESRTRPGLSLQVVEEASGGIVPHVVRPQVHERHRPRGIRIVFVAREVPAFGYARYLLHAVPNAESGDAPPATATLENEHYQVEVDTQSGCLRRLLDKNLDRDLIDPRGGVGFNQYVHDRYAVAANVGYLSSRITAAGDWLLRSRATAGEGHVVGWTSNPVYDQIRLQLAADGCSRLETTYTLIKGVRRLDIENRLFKLPSPDKESTYFAFPFAFPGAAPTIRYETTGGVDGPDLQRVPGSATHMRAIRHWVVVAGADAAVGWATGEAPLVEFGNIHLPYTPFPESIDRSHVSPGAIFSWVTNNVWDTNFPVQQGGEILFRYAVASGPPTTPAAEVGTLAASGVVRPLIGVLCSVGHGRLPSTGSFCEIDRPDVSLVTMTPSRKGSALTFYLQSMAEAEVEAGLRFPSLPVLRVFTGTYQEEHPELVPAVGGWFRTRLQPGEYRSIRVDLHE